MNVFVKNEIVSVRYQNVYAIEIMSDESRWHESEAMFDLLVSIIVLQSQRYAAK